MAPRATKSTGLLFSVLIWTKELHRQVTRTAAVQRGHCANERHLAGQGLAMLEMTLTLATVFRRYELTLEHGFTMEYLPGFTLRPKHGLPIRVARRVV
jgi:hypothetical protein